MAKGNCEFQDLHLLACINFSDIIFSTPEGEANSQGQESGLEAVPEAAPEVAPEAGRFLAM